MIDNDFVIQAVRIIIIVAIIVEAVLTMIGYKNRNLITFLSNIGFYFAIPLIAVIIAILFLLMKSILTFLF